MLLYVARLIESTLKISNTEDLEERLAENLWLIQKSENLNLGKDEK